MNKAKSCHFVTANVLNAEKCSNAVMSLFLTIFDIWWIENNHPEMRASILCNLDHVAAWMDSLSRNIRNTLRICQYFIQIFTFPHSLAPNYFFLTAQGRCHPSALCFFPFCNLYVNICDPSRMKRNIKQVNNEGKIWNISTYFLVFKFFFSTMHIRIYNKYLENT